MAAPMGVPASLVTLPVTVAESATAGSVAGMTMPSAPDVSGGGNGVSAAAGVASASRGVGTTITCPSVSRNVNGTAARSCCSACPMVASSHVHRSDRSLGSRLGL